MRAASINVVTAITKHALSSVGVINALRSNWETLRLELGCLTIFPRVHGSADRPSIRAEESCPVEESAVIATGFAR